MTTSIINYSFLLILLTYLHFFQKLNLNYILILALTSLVPFFLPLIMAITYNSDVIQFTYSANKFRSFIGLNELNYFTSTVDTLERVSFDHVSLSGMIYAYMIPVPFMDNFMSLGFFNRFIYIIFIAFLILRKKLDGLMMYILIFYPSIILYSNLALRDTLILIAMIFSIMYLIEKKYILSFIFLVLIYFLRPQNAILILPIIVVYALWFNNLFGSNRLWKSILIILIVTISVSIFSEWILDILNQYRIARYREDNISDENIYLAGNLIELLTVVFNFVPKFFLEPTILNFKNLFQLFQSIENIIIILLLIIVFVKLFGINKSKSVYWILALISIAGAYSYAQSNVGALARYKYVFIAMYFFAALYEIKLAQYYSNKVK